MRIGLPAGVLKNHNALWSLSYLIHQSVYEQTENMIERAQHRKEAQEAWR